MTTYTAEYIEQGRAYFAALGADRRWQLELEYQNIDRYAPEAKGVEDSELRLRYNAKVRADEELRVAIEALRAAGAPAEVSAINGLTERPAGCSSMFIHGVDCGCDDV